MRSVPRSKAPQSVVVLLACAAVGAGAYWMGVSRGRTVGAATGAPVSAPSDPLPASIDLSQLTPLLAPPDAGAKWEDDRRAAVSSMQRLTAYAARYNAGGLGASERASLHQMIRQEATLYDLYAATANALFKAPK